jgi:UDP-N-acetylenolpyruvoylglucosamine reductase
MTETGFLDGCRAIVGAAHVLVDAIDTAPFLTDWRGRFTGSARAVVLPADALEVAAVVRLCARHRVPLVPQGGRTGLVLGSVPDASGEAIVLSLRRLNRIRAVDPYNRTMTVDAGCILHDVQQAALEHGMLFPLSLAAEGSCTIGGNLGTNAGGTGVLRYGNTRELCLGLEVVTPAGELWDGLRGLRKDNTGYDLRDLFIGAEGTLGVITGAVLKLFPQPKAAVTALVALASPRHALELLKLVEAGCGPALTGYELMSDTCLRLVAEQFPDLPRPFAQPQPQYALLELSSHESEAHGVALLEARSDWRWKPASRWTPSSPARSPSRAACGRCANTFRWPRPGPARTSSTTFPCPCRRWPASSPAPMRCSRRRIRACRSSVSATWATATCTTTSRRRRAGPTRTSWPNRSGSTASCTTRSRPPRVRSRPNTASARSSAMNWRAPNRRSNWR